MVHSVPKNARKKQESKYYCSFKNTRFVFEIKKKLKTENTSK